MWNNLPEDLLAEVLVRILAKQLWILRAVSRSWRTLIEDETFIESHFLCSRQSSPAPALSSVQIVFDAKAAKEGPCSPYLAEFDSPEEIESTMRMDRIEYGFFYDETRNDYKVVRLVEIFDIHLRGDDSPIRTRVGQEIKMYSLKSNSWKCLPPDTFPDFVELDPCELEIGPGILIHNALHWVMLDRRWDISSDKNLKSIVALDVRTHKSHLVSPPDDDVFSATQSWELGVSNGCLTLVRRMTFDMSHLWIMEEYGVRDSWRRLRLDVRNWDLYPSFIGHPCGTGNKQCYVDGTNLVWYDRRSANLKPWVIDALNLVGGGFLTKHFRPSNLESIRRGCLFTHTLVPPRPSCEHGRKRIQESNTLHDDSNKGGGRRKRIKVLN
ncbi:OLC1v1014499C1 [Oldenlandia corymbosa var. corymbosa]|uniref:OLC1v1014499C1 n=1 Tax=Oldenlandia corymbosa var. corymbosa TaxID=529605 RepID=A0AAV1E4F0_OLDCO|nr:OLC1v1014499C1 [Oldenlandia corymbosa var. corymbosa]